MYNADIGHMQKWENKAYLKAKSKLCFRNKEVELDPFDHLYATLQGPFIYIYLYLVVLEFELRASGLLGRCQSISCKSPLEGWDGSCPIPHSKRTELIQITHKISQYFKKKLHVWHLEYFVASHLWLFLFKWPLAEKQQICFPTRAFHSPVPGN
jgi:hypothetical protein